MYNNIVDFKSKNDNIYIFDNSTGSVIPSKIYTKFIIENINISIEKLLLELKSKYPNFNEADFKKEISYINLLKNQGFFNNNFFSFINDFSNLYSGMLSQLILIVTEECNLRCKYCVYSDFYCNNKTYSKKQMSFETAKKAVDFYLKIHEEKVIRGYDDTKVINFYGGEPFLNFKLIKQIVEYIESKNIKNIKYSITTNGTLMNDYIIDFVSKHNFSLAFSLDGNEFNHDRNRVTKFGKKTHTLIERNLKKYYEKLTEYNKENSTISVSCCYDDYTDMNLVVNYFIKLEKTIPVLSIVFNKIYDIDTTYYEYCKQMYSNADNICKNSINNLFNKYYLNNENKNIPRVIKSLFFSYYILKNRKKFPIVIDKGEACVIGDKLCIDSEGKIYICERANQKLSIGDIESGLNFEIISDIYTKFFNIRKKHCYTCPALRLCDVCYIHLISDGDIKINKEFCAKRRKYTLDSLSNLYSVLENYPNIFNEF